MLLAHWRELLLIAASLLFGYLLLETGYRIYQYVTLPERLFRIVSMQRAIGPASTDQYMYDPDIGYRYTPNYEGRRGPPWNSHWRTNAYGHVSQYHYPKEKPANEFRVVILGDSFTAGITNNVRWPELLESQLNASPEWKARVNGRFTRVINAAVDGFGIVQMAAMLRTHAIAFEPDLVIVNFVTDDILRRVRYNNVPYSSNDHTEVVPLPGTAG